MTKAPSRFSPPFEEIAAQQLAAIHFPSPQLCSPAVTNTHLVFVTLNDFQQRADDIRHFSNSLFVSIIPVVTEEQRLQFTPLTTLMA
jgi:hypothetical protein